MANWQKRNARFYAQLERDRSRWESMSEAEKDAERARMNAGTDAENDGYVTDGRTFDDMAREIMASEPKNSLLYALAEAELQRETWCGLADDVTREQARQAKMRRKYGVKWSGSVKISRFSEMHETPGESRARRTVRWLQLRGFVDVGNGYVKWVGPLQ